MAGPGCLYIITAPSGAGKTSLVHALVNQDDGLVVSISHTTRAPRPGEVDGQNYHFVDKDVFETMLSQHVFLEHANVFGHYYGTSSDRVAHTLAQGKDVILEIDWQGAEQVRERWVDAESPLQTIFILPPSLKALGARLAGRGQDKPDVIANRLAGAQEEISHCQVFDYWVINDDFETALEDLTAIIRANRLTRRVQQAQYAPLVESLLSNPST